MAKPENALIAKSNHTGSIEGSVFYKLRVDTMMIVGNLNNGKEYPSGEVLKKQIVFVQSQLFLAAVADPKVSQELKNELVAFHNNTVRDLLDDKRGSKNRNDSNHVKIVT
jgi:hypothetical protein